MYRKLWIIVALVTFALAGSLSAARAHEFIIKPVVMKVKAGEKIPFSVVSAHRFMVSEEMEPIKHVEVVIAGESGSTPVALHPNEALMTLDGQAVSDKEGTLILAGHRKGIIWTQTTEGWKQAGKKELSGVISSGKYEKFAKALVTVGQSNGDYAKKLGHKLEIVPLSDPAKASVGDYLPVQVLYDGKPMATEVMATYDGFVDIENTYAYFTETGEDNKALIKITHPGIWMVRAQKILEESTDDYDKHVIRSVLVFEVK